MCQPWLASSLRAYGVDMLACRQQLYHVIFVGQMVQLEENTREIPPPFTWSFAAKVPFIKEVAVYQDRS